MYPAGIADDGLLCGAAGCDSRSARPRRRLIAVIVRWWEEITAKGGEGMVIEPADFVVHGKRGLIQPSIKCRGPEYPRIIYGPEYSRPEHVDGSGTADFPRSILLKYLLKRRAARLRVVAQPRKHGGHDVFHFLSDHSIACRYGQWTP